MKFVTKLDRLLSDGKSLTKKELKYCNSLYEFYSGVYEKVAIDCLKHDNPLINKKLKEVSVEEGRTIATELFQILNKRGDALRLERIKVGIDPVEVPLSMLLNLWFSSTQKSSTKNSQ